MDAGFYLECVGEDECTTIEHNDETITAKTIRQGSSYDSIPPRNGCSSGTATTDDFQCYRGRFTSEPTCASDDVVEAANDENSMSIPISMCTDESLSDFSDMILDACKHLMGLASGSPVECSSSIASKSTCETCESDSRRLTGETTDILFQTQGMMTIAHSGGREKVLEFLDLVKRDSDSGSIAEAFAAAFEDVAPSGFDLPALADLTQELAEGGLNNAWLRTLQNNPDLVTQMPTSKLYEVEDDALPEWIKYAAIGGGSALFLILVWFCACKGGKKK